MYIKIYFAYNYLLIIVFSMQKSYMNKTYRLSLPQQEKLKNLNHFRQLQPNNLFSFKKIKKQSSFLEGFVQAQNKKVSLPNISFNNFKQKLAQYLRPSLSAQHEQTKHRYQQVSNNTPSKTEKYKTKMFRMYKKNKTLVQMNQTQEEIGELQKDFNVKQVELKKRLSINKQQTFHNMTVKRDCLRYYGQNKCFQKALHFRKTPSSTKKQRVVQVGQKQKQKIEKQYIQTKLQYSVLDLSQMKVQPWFSQREELEEKEFSQIQDHQ